MKTARPTSRARLRWAPDGADARSLHPRSERPYRHRPRGVSERPSGAQIDALARLPLWRAGLDFDHGTGHGVGSYLSVHEGPQRISKLGSTPLEPGMILSDEPGYYYAGHWGIRIENLVVVEPSEDSPAPSTKCMDSKP